MKLKDLITTCADLGITIHRSGQLDGHYLYASDIESDLYDFNVVEVSPSYCPDQTDLYVWIEEACR